MAPDTPPYNTAATPGTPAGSPEGSKDAVKALASGFVINFAAKERATLADVFGNQPLSPLEVINTLWKYIKDNKLVARRQS